MSQIIDKPAEVLLYEFLAEQFGAAVPDSLFWEIELHDTIYQKITRKRGARISDCSAAFSPYGDAEKEFDAAIEVVVFSRVEGKNKSARQPALTDVFRLQRSIYTLIRNNGSLGGRVCDTVLLRGARGYDVYDGEPYAVASIPLIINPSGENYR
ncbi:MAG: hypothetical protein KIS76_03845 [Pyrinomonadaceae bacterium]|nr:hypothetical protein [Pyrinomonadaceae bacterium]